MLILSRNAYSSAGLPTCLWITSSNVSYHWPPSIRLSNSKLPELVTPHASWHRRAFSSPSLKLGQEELTKSVPSTFPSPLTFFDSFQAALARDVKEELETTLGILSGKGKGAKGKVPRGIERKKLWNDVKALRKE